MPGRSDGAGEQVHIRLQHGVRLRFEQLVRAYHRGEEGLARGLRHLVLLLEVLHERLVRFGDLGFRRRPVVLVRHTQRQQQIGSERPVADHGTDLCQARRDGVRHVPRGAIHAESSGVGDRGRDLHAVRESRRSGTGSPGGRRWRDEARHSGHGPGVLPRCFSSSSLPAWTSRSNAGQDPVLVSIIRDSSRSTPNRSQYAMTAGSRQTASAS